MPFDIISSPDCEIVTSRIVNAPIYLAFSCWADPENLKNWWGPKGFTNTFHEFNFIPGGIWRFTMHGPEKGNYQNECVFIQIDRPNLIYWKRISKPLFNVLVTFKEMAEEKTEIVFKQIFETSEECNKLKPYVVDKNEENFDKLELELSRMKH